MLKNVSSMYGVYLTLSKKTHPKLKWINNIIYNRKEIPVLVMNLRGAKLRTKAENL